MKTNNLAMDFQTFVNIMHVRDRVLERLTKLTARAEIFNLLSREPLSPHLNALVYELTFSDKNELIEVKRDFNNVSIQLERIIDSLFGNLGYTNH
jgi:hypothetical protein